MRSGLDLALPSEISEKKQVRNQRRILRSYIYAELLKLMKAHLCDLVSLPDHDNALLREIISSFAETAFAMEGFEGISKKTLEDISREALFRVYETIDQQRVRSSEEARVSKGLSGLFVSKKIAKEPSITRTTSGLFSGSGKEQKTLAKLPEDIFQEAMDLYHQHKDLFDQHDQLCEQSIASDASIKSKLNKLMTEVMPIYTNIIKMLSSIKKKHPAANRIMQEIAASVKQARSTTGDGQQKQPLKLILKEFGDAYYLSRCADDPAIRKSVVELGLEEIFDKIESGSFTDVSILLDSLQASLCDAGVLPKKAAEVFSEISDRLQAHFSLSGDRFPHGEADSYLEPELSAPGIVTSFSPKLS